MPDPPYTVRLLSPPNTNRPERSSRSHTSKSLTIKHRRSTPHTPRLTLLSLPAALIHSSILPFLAPHRKLCHLSHISHSFPPLDSSAFRHDCLTLTTQQAAWFPKLHPAYLQLVSSCHSLWLQSTDGTLTQQSTSRDDVKRDVLLSTLTLAATFSAVRRLRLPLPSVSLYAAAFLARLITSTTSFAHCHTVLLDDEDGLRKLAVEQVAPLVQLPVLCTVRLINCRLPLSTITFLCCSLPTLTTLDTTDCWYSPFDLSSVHCPPHTAASVRHLRHLSLPSRSEGKAGARCTTKAMQFFASSSARLTLSSLSLHGHASVDSGLSSFESLTSLSINTLESNCLLSLCGDSSPSAVPLPLLQHVSLSCHNMEAATRVSDGGGSLQSMLYTFFELYRPQLRSVRLELPSTTLLSNLLRPLSTCSLLDCLHLTVRSSIEPTWPWPAAGEEGYDVNVGDAMMYSALRSVAAMPTLSELVLDGVEWSDEQLRAVLLATTALRRLAMTRVERLTATALQALSSSCPQLEQLHMSALHCAPPQQLQQLHHLTRLHSLGGLQYDTLPRALKCCVYAPLDDEEDGGDMQWSSYDSSVHRGAVAAVAGEEAGGGGQSGGSERWEGSAECVLWWSALRFVSHIRVKGKVVSGRQQFFHELDRLCAQNEKRSKRGGQRKQREKKIVT